MSEDSVMKSLKSRTLSSLMLTFLLAFLCLPTAFAQISKTDIPAAITTPDSVETRTSVPVGWRQPILSSGASVLAALQNEVQPSSDLLTDRTRRVAEVRPKALGPHLHGAERITAEPARRYAAAASAARARVELALVRALVPHQPAAERDTLEGDRWLTRALENAPPACSASIAMGSCLVPFSPSDFDVQVELFLNHLVNRFHAFD
jgi:hypothetical protein